MKPRSNVRALLCFMLGTVIAPSYIGGAATGSERLREGWNTHALAGESGKVSAIGRFPMAFETNHGQARNDARFVSRGKGYALLLKPREAVITLTGPLPGRTRSRGSQLARPASATVRMRLLGANGRPAIQGVDALPGKANYFLGSSSRNWRTGIPLYAKVIYRQVYPGVDLIFYGNQQRLEFDFRVAPGADPGKIRLSYSGIQRLRIDGSGDLVLSTKAGDLRQHKPRVYQVKDGSPLEVPGGYRIRGRREVGFELGPYDAGEPLVIDPVLTYATYLGGNRDDEPAGIALDSSENIYVAGTTASINFPVTPGSLSAANRGACDVFVSKFTKAGALVYSTYIGGSACDHAYWLAVDPDGNAYVAGETRSTNFPTVNALQASNRGGLEGFDGFVAKLSPEGSQLVYSTYLGGTLDDAALAIAVDSQGHAFVAGMTLSNNFPTTASAYQTTKLGLLGGFVTKLSASGATLVYSTYIGGSQLDVATSIAIDPAGNAYVSGESLSPDFPTTGGVVQTQNHGDGDLFVTKLDPPGAAAVWSTLLGGKGEDCPYGSAIDAHGNVYLTGYTDSTDFPVTGNALQKNLKGWGDAFLVKIGPSGTSLVYSTYLGGSYDDSSFGVSVNSVGNAFVAGYTDSPDFPTVAPFQAALRGDSDCFLAEIDTTVGGLRQATYLGGSGGEDLCSIVLGQADTVYVTGETEWTDFPVTRDAFQPTYRGTFYDYDAFLAKVDFSAAAATVSFSPAEMEFLGAINASIPGKTLTLVAATGTLVDWTIEVTTTSGGSWLDVSQRTGAGSATVEVTVTTTALGANTYLGTITVTNQATGAIMAIVPVTLTVVKLATTVSAASYAAGGPLAPESIASAFGQGLATSTQAAVSLPLPTTLASRTVKVKDSAGTERAAPLFFVSPGQINYLIPAGTRPGAATVTITGLFSYVVAAGALQIEAVAPGLFTANASGQGVAAAVALRVAADNSQSHDNVFQCGATAGSCVTKPIDLGSETDRAFLLLYGTGIRGRSSLSAVGVKVGGVDAPVEYAGPVAGFVGLDQVNVRLPRSLLGRGEVEVVLTVDGKIANTVTVSIK